MRSRPSARNRSASLESGSKAAAASAQALQAAVVSAAARSEGGAMRRSGILVNAAIAPASNVPSWWGRSEPSTWSIVWSIFEETESTRLRSRARRLSNPTDHAAGQISLAAKG